MFHCEFGGPSRASRERASAHWCRARMLAVPLLLLTLSGAGHAQTLKHVGDIQPKTKEPLRDFFGIGLSSNGMTLAVAVPNTGKEECVILYDTETRQETARWKTSGFLPYTLLFSPNGNSLILHGTRPGTRSKSKRLPSLVESWDVDKQKVRWRLPLSNLEGHQIHLTPDGKTLVALGEEQIQLIDAVTGKITARFAEESAGPSPVSVLSPDGKYLAVREFRKHALRLYDLTTGKLTASFNPFPQDKDHIRAFDVGMAFTPDSKHLTMLMLLDGELATFAVPRGKEVSRLAAKPMTRPLAMAYARDGKTLIIAGEDHGTGISALSAESGKASVPKGKVIYGARTIAISADGRMVALAKNGEVHLWRVDTKKKD
jgi:DNA-binding beta-propeller fold protein YncE